MKERESARAAAAFLQYARYGFDRRGACGADVFDMAEAIRGSTADRQEARRMMAVYDTLRLLEHLGKREELLAARAVYFAGHGRRLRRNDISLRVRRFAAEYYLDDRTVYRRLAEVKRLFLALSEEN